MKPAMVLQLGFRRFEEVGHDRIHSTVDQPVLHYCLSFPYVLTTYFYLPLFKLFCIVEVRDPQKLYYSFFLSHCPIKISLKSRAFVNKPT